MRRVFLRVVLATAVLVPTAAIAQAGSPTDATPPKSELGVESDVRLWPTPEEMYASDYGVAVDEARERLAAQQTIHEGLEAVLSRLARARLSGSWIDHSTDEVSGWIAVTGDDPLPEEVLDIAEARGLNVRYGDAHSLDELLAALEAFEITGPLTFGEVDERLNSIRLGIQAGAQGVEHDQRLLGDISLVVEVSETLENAALLRGGEPMLVGSTTECTSGFAVSSPYTGKRGIATAGHCPDAMTQNGVTLPLVQHAPANNVDAQWHETSLLNPVSGYFRCNVGGPHPQYCAVEAWSSTNVGMYVCHTGAKTGVSCGTVDSVTNKPKHPNAGCVPTGYTSPCAANFIRATGPSLKGCRGDSGSPLFRTGGMIHGISKAATLSTNCTATGKSVVFSKLAPMHSGLAVVSLFAGQ